MNPKYSNQGFTLTELLVAMAVSGIVMASVYSSYYTQQRSFITQQQVASMQQNIRTAVYYMERDIRMAGYDPTGTAGAGITSATPTSFQFTFDYDGDGSIGTGETILYQTYTTGGTTALRRTPGGAPVAKDVDALNFVYLDDSGNVTMNAADIRWVQVTLVVRTARVEQGYSDPNTYTNQQGATIFTPTGNSLNYRRRVLAEEIRCRNLGLL